MNMLSLPWKATEIIPTRRKKREVSSDPTGPTLRNPIETKKNRPTFYGHQNKERAIIAIGLNLSKGPTHQLSIPPQPRRGR